MATAIIRYMSDIGTPPAEKEVTLVSGKYTFVSDDLPVMTYDGYSFAGWFFDGEYIEPGDELHADDGEVIELNAGWGAAVMPADDTGEIPDEGESGTEVQYLGKAGITHYHERVKMYVEEEIDAHAVKYDAAQELTDEQKTQARANIDVASKEYVDEHDVLIFEISYDTTAKVYTLNTTYDELSTYIEQHRNVILSGSTAGSSYIHTWRFANKSASRLTFSYAIDYMHSMVAVYNDNTVRVSSASLVPTSRSINGYKLDNNLELTASDVSSMPAVYQDVSITWDGNTTDLEVVTYNSLLYYKVSDDVLTETDLIDGEVTRYTVSSGIDSTTTLTPSIIYQDVNGGSAFHAMGIITGKEGSYSIPLNSERICSCTIPSDGTYFLNTSQLYNTSFQCKRIEPLKEQYIPDTIARTSDVNSAIDATREYVDTSIETAVETHNSSTTAHSDIRTALDGKVNVDDVIPVAQGGTGRSTVADTEYTVIKYRGSALVTAETNPTENGTICWTYE